MLFVYTCLVPKRLLSLDDFFATAGSVWLSAAVGISCGGGLYFVAFYTTALLLVMLRFLPREVSRSELPTHHSPDKLKANTGNTGPARETPGSSRASFRKTASRQSMFT